MLIRSLRHDVWASELRQGRADGRDELEGPSVKGSLKL